MEQTYLTLNNDAKIPQFGMGVYQVLEGEETKQAFLSALRMGYRHIDTAHAYQNERSVGAAVQKSGISRKEVVTPINRLLYREADIDFIHANLRLRSRSRHEEGHMVLWRSHGGSQQPHHQDG